MGGTGNLPVAAGYQSAGNRAASCRPRQAGSLFHQFQAGSYNDMCETGSLQSLEPVLPPIARAWMV